VRVESRSPALFCGDGYVTIQVIARPGASRQELARRDSGEFVIALNSPPEKGKANQELLRVLAGVLRIPRSQMVILRGHAARRKTVRIASGDPAALAATIDALAPPAGHWSASERRPS